MRRVSTVFTLLWATSLFLMLTALGMARPSTALACSCSGPTTPEEAIRGATAVFAGRVTQITEESQPDEGPATLGRLFVMEVLTSWKGHVGSTITIGAGDLNCGIGFSLNERWLVYASSGANGVLRAWLCSGTRPLMSAREDIAWLGRGDPPLDADTTAAILGVDKSVVQRLEGLEPYIRLALAVVIGAGCLLGLLWLRRWRRRNA